jgi:hypothetical protein
MIYLSYTSTEEITDLVPKCLDILARIKYMYQTHSGWVIPL